MSAKRWGVPLRHIAPVALVLALTVVAFFVARELGERSARRDAERRADVAAAQISGRIEHGASLTESLRRAFSDPDAQALPGADFERLASRWLSPAGFPAAAWIERVPADQRAGYERRVGQPIVERDRGGRIARVGSQPFYLPATLVSGIPPMAVSGIDLGDEPAVSATLARARALRTPRSTPMITVRDGTRGIMLVDFAPRSVGRAERPGFVAVFIPARSLLDAADPAVSGITTGGTAAPSGDDAKTVRRSFTRASRRFAVAVPVGRVHGASAALPWLILATGLVLAALAAALGLNAARRARAQNELDRIFTLSPDLITVAGLDGRFKRVNPAVEQILGYSADELLTHPYLELVHPDDLETTVAEVRSIEDGKTNLSFENRFARKDGSYRVLEWTATPSMEDQLMYGVARDVTERRKAEEELEELVDEQAALRRIATLVVRGVPADEVFSAVAAELERLFDAEATLVARLENDETMTVVASGGRARELLAVGSRLELETDMAIARAVRTGRPARVVDYTNAPGVLGQATHRANIHSAVAAPIVVQGSVWGSMGAGTEREEFPPDTEQRLAKFTELVGTAISNIQARAELEASRARIVQAADDERRRVVRDLHDGAQQRLVHSIITLKLTQRALQSDEPADELVSEALQQAEQANVELRELSHGILPSVLTHGGLRGAVEALATRTPVPVDVDIDVDRLPGPTEATAYFVVAEALTNVAKHANASAAKVEAHIADNCLQLQVRDDGVGGARTDGTGLVGLADRLAAVDGRLRVESPANGGTLVVADIPLAAGLS